MCLCFYYITLIIPTVDLHLIILIFAKLVISDLNIEYGKTFVTLCKFDIS